jgi:hypothetical protein
MGCQFSEMRATSSNLFFTFSSSAICNPSFKAMRLSRCGASESRVPMHFKQRIATKCQRSSKASRRNFSSSTASAYMRNHCRAIRTVPAPSQSLVLQPRFAWRFSRSRLQRTHRPMRAPMPSFWLPASGCRRDQCGDPCRSARGLGLRSCGSRLSHRPHHCHRIAPVHEPVEHRAPQLRPLRALGLNHALVCSVDALV